MIIQTVLCIGRFVQTLEEKNEFINNLNDRVYTLKPSAATVVWGSNPRG